MRMWSDLGANLCRVLKKIREHFLPNQHFYKVDVFRGGFARFTSFFEVALEGEGFVIMWRHGEAYPHVYVPSVPLAAFLKDDFDPTQWTICLFWEPSDQSQPDEPSPREVPMPGDDGGSPTYSDPNLPMQPPPGLTRPDEDMPPPDDEMPQAAGSP